MGIFSGKEDSSSELCRSSDLGCVCKEQGPDQVLMSPGLRRQKNSLFMNLSFVLGFPLDEVGTESFRALLEPHQVLSRLWDPPQCVSGPALLMSSCLQAHRTGRDCSWLQSPGKLVTPTPAC